MKVVDLENTPPANLTVKLEDLHTPKVVTLQDEKQGEFVVMYESWDGQPTDRCIAGLRYLANELEKNRKAFVADAVRRGATGVA